MAAQTVILFLGTLQGLPAALENHSVVLSYDGVYCELPRFWTNTGFCPAGGIQHHSISQALLSDAVQLNLRYISALPVGAVTHIRIHWLLQLLQFVQYTQAGLPVFDFTQLDEFLLNLDELGLFPVIEFMANPGGIFIKNPNRNSALWENFSYQVTKRYLNLLGAKQLLNWRFESWNEPDVQTYNRLKFTIANYIEYLMALRRGLIAAGRRSNSNNLHFPLRGPAGLFKNESNHPLCWGLLTHCNAKLEQCPIEVLTYHRKGNGTSGQVLAKSSLLLREIYKRFPALQTMPISNDEADPIAGWSTPRIYHEDVRYAAMLLDIVFDHWSAMLQSNEFQRLESISHDNAFLSYHPYEFAQRTLLAHFRMNDSTPIHSQFIQKPVYAALGLLAKLGALASNVDIITLNNCMTARRLRTKAKAGESTYLSWLLVPNTASVIPSMENCITSPWRLNLPMHDFSGNEQHAYILEALEAQHTDPAHVWRSNGAPPYPNSTLREAMRQRQTPALLQTGPLYQSQIEVKSLNAPFALLLRVCTNTTLVHKLQKPQKLNIIAITKGEALLTWREVVGSVFCLLRYEVWYQAAATNDWRLISNGWQLPFPTFQYAPNDNDVNGFYKVRGVDMFNRSSEFSDALEYIEL